MNTELAIETTEFWATELETYKVELYRIFGSYKEEGYTRADAEAALRELVRQGKAALMPEQTAHKITDQMAEGAFQLSLVGQPVHYIILQK